MRDKTFGVNPMRGLFGTLLLTILISGCATNPVTGKSELTFVSESEEISIGSRQYLPAQQSQGGTYDVDPELTRYVTEVGKRLATVSDRALPYEFVVINDSTPNAWALPGGKIPINRGLLMQLENEAELAAVLGHEIVHAAARHGARAMERAMLLQGAVMLTALGSKDSEYSNYIVGGASIGAQLISQRYGRQAELEADRYGMEYMAQAGYDPNAAVSLQEKFVALKDGQSPHWLEGLFASHPPSAERVQKNTEKSQEIRALQHKDWEVGQARYDHQLAYLESKKEAYQSFDQANTLLADKEIAVALNRIERAIRLESAEPRFLGLKADVLFQQKKYSNAISQYSDALKHDDAYYEYYLGRGLSHSKLGNRSKAKTDLEKSNSLLPTALATNELGNLALNEGDRASAKQYFGEVARTSGSLSEAARQSFVRLDLSDNPASYFRVQSQLREGQFFSAITNNSGLRVKSAVVQFNARINGEIRQASRRTGPLANGQTAGLYPGWALSETDLVDGINVRVLSVTL